MRTAYLALGTNLGDRVAQLRDAIARLNAAAGIRALRVSRIYETEPVGVTEQPRFLNMVVEVEIPEAMAPGELLRLVKQIEADVGRQQRERWGPREIDIDVLLIGEERVSEPDLEVPHPRMWERAFVVVPLADLAPEVRAPGGETAGDLARRLARGGGIGEFPRPASGNGGPGMHEAWFLAAPVAVVTCHLSLEFLAGLLNSAGLATLMFLTALLGLVFVPAGLVAALVLLLRRRQGGVPLSLRLLGLAFFVAVPVLYVRAAAGPPPQALPLFASGFRRYVASRAGERELTAAAAQLIGRHKRGDRRFFLPHGEIADVTKTPVSVGRLNPGGVVVYPPRNAQGLVRVDWGGPLFRWGLDITPSGVRYFVGESDAILSSDY